MNFHVVAARARTDRTELARLIPLWLLHLRERRYPSTPRSIDVSKRVSKSKIQAVSRLLGFRQPDTAILHLAVVAFQSDRTGGWNGHRVD